MEEKLTNVDLLADSLQGFLKNEIFAENAYMMIQRTDKFIILRLSGPTKNPDTLDVSHALEIRLFSEAGEVKWTRDSIADRAFIRREKLADQMLTENVDYWDEEQYLDIDTSRSDIHRQMAKATGGGEYSLPVIGQETLSRRNGVSGSSKIMDYNDLKIVIRNYLDYEEDTGRAFICDWRVVGFVKER